MISRLSQLSTRICKPALSQSNRVIRNRICIYRLFGQTNEKQNFKERMPEKNVKQSMPEKDAKEKIPEKDAKDQSQEEDIKDENQEKFEQIDGWVREHRIVLFMKGSPKMPMCDQSKAIVSILSLHNIRDYKAIDILEHQAMLDAIKLYSDWPTFPQLYINGELVGGSDIVKDMHNNGTLIDELSKASS